MENGDGTGAPDTMEQTKTPVRRPGIGIAIDRHKLKGLREAALLERIDLSDLTKLTELRRLARDYDIPGIMLMDHVQLSQVLTDKGATLPRHIGISRDAIAKIENGDRLRPKISTLRILIDTLNMALALRGEATIGIADLYHDDEDSGDQEPDTTAHLEASGYEGETPDPEASSDITHPD